MNVKVLKTLVSRFITQNISLQSRFLSIGFLYAVSVIFMVDVSYAIFKKAEYEFSRMNKILLPQIDLSVHLKSNFDALYQHFEQAVESKKRRGYSFISSDIKQFQKLVEQLDVIEKISEKTQHAKNISIEFKNFLSSAEPWVASAISFEMRTLEGNFEQENAQLQIDSISEYRTKRLAFERTAQKLQIQLDALYRDSQLALEYGHSSVHDLFSKLALRIIIIGGIAIIIGFISLYLSTQKMLEPLNHILRQLKQKFQITPDLNIKDEMVLMYASFQALLQQLESSTQKQEKLEHLLDCMADPLVIISSDGFIQKVNSALLSMTSFRAEDLINKEVETLIEIHPEKQNDHERKLVALVKQGSIKNYELFFIDAKSKKIPVEVSAVTMKENENISFLFMAREKKIIIKTEDFSAFSIVENIPLALILVNSALQIRHANSHFFTQFASNSIGSKLSEIVSAGFEEEVKRFLKDSSQKTRKGEFVERSKNISFHFWMTKTFEPDAQIVILFETG